MKRRYGQHFLKDPGIVRRLVEASGVTKSDAVLEIGPGQGVLTRALAAAAGQVLAVEIDRRLHAALASSGMPANVDLLQGDALVLDPADIVRRLGPSYLLVSNLPYEISSSALLKFLPLRHRTGYGPRSLTLMLQKEVGERIIARRGMNRLALFCGLHAAADILFDVPPGAFSPPPKVRSCAIRLDVLPEPLLDAPKEERLLRLAEAAFRGGRKKLRNTLSPALGDDLETLLTAAGIDPEARPESVPLKQWISLAQRV